MELHGTRCLWLGMTLVALQMVRPRPLKINKSKTTSCRSQNFRQTHGKQLNKKQITVMSRHSLSHQCLLLSLLIICYSITYTCPSSCTEQPRPFDHETHGCSSTREIIKGRDHHSTKKQILIWNTTLHTSCCIVSILGYLSMGK